MSLELTLLTSPLYIELPHDLLGWLALFAALVFLVYMVRLLWGYHPKYWQNRQWSLLFFLGVLVPLTSLLVVLRLPSGEALPPFGKPIDPAGTPLLIFSALPWVLAAGLLGPAPAAIIGAFSGVLLALWGTHSSFTPLETASLALALSVFLRQRYRTQFFHLLRHPFVAAALAAVFYPILFFINTLFLAGGTLVNRLDYAITHVGPSSLALGVPLLVAGIFAEAVAALLVVDWGGKPPWIPSPAERRLENRFLFSVAPLAVILLAVLLVGDWLVAGNAAREMLRERMGSTAQIVSDTLPFFLESGQNLIKQLAKNPALYNSPPASLHELMGEELRSVPFFRQLYLLNENGDAVAGYPEKNYFNSYPPPEELTGIELALNGVPIQTYTIPPLEGESAAQVSFLAAVVDNVGEIKGVLVGRSDLAFNPFTEPVLAGIRNMVGEDGEGMLLDGSGRVLFHQNGLHLMEDYTGRTSEGVLFYDDTAPDGTRRLVYYQPVVGHPWSVVLAVPARRAQQMALDIATPLLVMVIVLFIAGLVILRFGLKRVTFSLQSLSLDANRIASGQLDQPLSVQGEDEVGQLRRSFDQMRASLKERLDELNQLLAVSQGVASSLEMGEAVQLILESALSTGASSARVILAPSDSPAMLADETCPECYGIGPDSNSYALLDDQILEISSKQDCIPMTNLLRSKLLKIVPGMPRPEAVLALALRHENTYYGSLWIAFNRPHQFSSDEIRFMVTIAGQAALAAANTRLFESAELGRQRLGAILASSPDPVLVTDYRNRLLLTNPAAWQVLGMTSEPESGRPVEEVTAHHELVKLLLSPADENQSAEITLADGRIYLATVSPVLADEQRVGRVCVMRDITHFKELDALKSDFVATVSHDLRSPLTLMSGYATMLEMLGELNEQQSGYMKKILHSVENMTRLVNNLLNLGRLEAGIDLELEMLPVHELVERVTNAMQLQATQKRVQLSLEIPSQTVPLIEADPALLQQALQNLIENAIKYTDGGGTVKVNVYTRQNGMIFEVCDSGIGIAPVDQPRLFEKFYRGAQRESKKPHGSGLGLAIVKSIAQRHNGDVWVKSQLGKGSIFYLMIPLRQPSRSHNRKISLDK
jgi:PAS domain S-box-containing protein